jgi:hypothetical protein
VHLAAWVLSEPVPCLVEVPADQLALAHIAGR